VLDTPEITQMSPQLTAIVHLTLPRNEIQHAMGPGLAEVRAAVADQGIAAPGPWFTHHRRMDPGTFDFEICLPVAAPVTAVGRVEPSEVPAATVARTVYRGPFEGLGDAWGEFDAWLTANGHTPAADLWERYLAGPESSPDPTEWRTELNRPLVG
jgi:effector-binding domain-containing protein